MSSRDKDEFVSERDFFDYLQRLRQESNREFAQSEIQEAKRAYEEYFRTWYEGVQRSAEEARRWSYPGRRKAELATERVVKNTVDKLERAKGFLVSPERFQSLSAKEGAVKLGIVFGVIFGVVEFLISLPHMVWQDEDARDVLRLYRELQDGLQRIGCQDQRRALQVRIIEIVRERGHELNESQLRLLTKIAYVF